ncbi:uncharacterized protein LOC123211940 [Mangifera indica]|uniref:uncharacterized protein LOC123211940 n=1 Tax=Mangifera indica TaxID=29780 RepID=UPI001CFC16CC|nr:uncharacterized protein LOC123211940 [Mangifera indica]XP_044486863.1 uncharacterized protein LOC123211940 [Mangifera indica]
MRGRSHRFQSVDPHDDWVDGSWTVDCVCGVTFDDGEEMVNCDECGVWVHTRCSKYVKGEESFACDKCKSKNSRNSIHNDSEETEVAQLLVELPTKTVRLESSYSGPARRPVRLWTDIPMENRVHVQGIPGGDPQLFHGLSAVFTPELWKCTGYVPKKFNFQYREFPCWDEKEGVRPNGEDTDKENPVDKGAGVLFSLSKESVLETRVGALVGEREEEGGFDKKVYSKEMKWEGEGVDARRSQNGMKKERSLLRTVVVHSGKRKKEDLGMSKDRSGKKKARAGEKEADERKKSLHGSRTVFRPTSDAKQLEFYEDRGPKSSKTDIQIIKNKNVREDVHHEPMSDGLPADNTGADRSKTNLAANECPLEALSSDVTRHFPLNGDGLKEEMIGHQLPAASKSSLAIDDIARSMLEDNDTRNVSSKQEGDSIALDKVDDSEEASAKSAQKSHVEDVDNVAQVVGNNQILEDLSGVNQNSVLPCVEVKTEVDNEDSRASLNLQSSSGDAKVQNKMYNHMSGNSKVNDIMATCSQSSDHKAKGAERILEAVSDYCSDEAHEVTGDPCQIRRELNGLDGPIEMQKGSPEPKHDPGSVKDQSKSEGNSFNSVALTGQQKTVVSVGKSSSILSSTVATKSSASENVKPEDSHRSNLNAKQRVSSENNVSIKNDRAVGDIVRDEEKHDVLRKAAKEHSKSSVNPSSKVSHSSRTLHATSKRTMSDSKDSVVLSSSKLSSGQNVAVASVSGESAGSVQSQCSLKTQNKMSTSGLPLKSEKLNQSNFQPSPKVNHAASMHPPAASKAPAILSDEELALLLHQELNSSPRVPRVPRVRHTGSLPQLASPTATSMLMKRSSSSGGKDHSLVSRRKSKDALKDGFRSSRELDDEARKVDRVPSSPDLRRHDMGYAADTYTRREENGSPTAVNSVKKNMPSVSNTTANSGPSSSTEVNDHNVSSVRCSPRNISDDDTGTNRGPVHQTLPGLINDIMSKGKRMTYEELCNAVLPHWPHLRKHNGERYAYSSHSQAVLDCLRNRHEWARLVDRGPKTSSTRKRRKFDADESEDNDYGNGRSGKDEEIKSLESQREEFPKGKRKARKRRRLALQGRGIKDVRRRRKADLASEDDEVGLFSNSSDESLFSEDETHGGSACPAGSEASISSDETGTT